MYYEEKIIDKILCYRHTPDGEWTQYTIEELTAMYADAKRQISIFCQQGK